MSFTCLLIALILTSVLIFVSYVQLLYLESLRIIRREAAALEHFREDIAGRIGLDSERGSLAFSVLKHLALPLVGVFYLCTLVRPDAPGWQSVLEAIASSVAAMFISTYLIPAFLYRRTSGLWLLKCVPVIRVLAFIATPFAAVVRGFHSLIDIDGNSSPETSPTDSVENIEALITAGAEEGIFEEQDRKLIHSVVAFGAKSVREVMTPRPDVIAISGTKSIEDLRQLVIHEQFSRIPVYEETIDNITGFIHVRDIFELDEEERQSKTLQDLIRPIQLVPETKPVTDLLREMQRQASHLSVVVDEYGNTAGIVTMEDLVEEILGEIRDEHEPDRDVRQESETIFVAPGALDLDRLEELLEFRPEDDTESTTIGGLITEWLGHVPQPGESVERDGVRFEVLASNGRRVDEVRISRIPLSTPAAANQ